MPRWFRTSLLIISLVQMMIAIACLLRLPIVEDLWPLDYTGRGDVFHLFGVDCGSRSGIHALVRLRG